MEISKIPSLGCHLLLDFFDVSSHIPTDPPALLSKITALLSDLGEFIGSIHQKPHKNGNTSFVFLLECSQMTLHSFPATKCFSLDYYIMDEDDSFREKMLRIEEVFCDLFSWKSCVSSILLSRGKTTQFFLNDDCNIGTVFKNLQYIWREKSKYQDIRVYDTADMGRVLILDGNIQISNQLQDNYTTDMVSPVISKEISYENVLILGGGDLVIATYLLENFPLISRLTMVEIDERVCEVVKTFFKTGETIKKETETGRFSLIFQDGAEFVRQIVEQNQSFDGIIIDCTDVDVAGSASSSLFCVAFYENLRKIMKNNTFFSQQVSDVQSKAKFEQMVFEAGFREISVSFSDTPEYSVALPIGVAKRTNI